MMMIEGELKENILKKLLLFFSIQNFDSFSFLFFPPPLLPLDFLSIYYFLIYFLMSCKRIIFFKLKEFVGNL